MANLEIINELQYTPPIVLVDDTESEVSFIWETRVGHTTTVEATGSGTMTWNSSNNRWESGAINVGSAPTSAGSSVFYQLSANDIISGVDTSAQTGFISAGFLTFTAPPSGQVCFSLTDSPGQYDWDADTYLEFSWEDVSVADNNLDVSNVFVKGFLQTDEYGSDENEIVVTKGSNTQSVALGSDVNDPNWVSPRFDFTGETSDGTWEVKITDNFGDGGVRLTGGSLCFGEEPPPSAFNLITDSAVNYNTANDGDGSSENWVNFQLDIQSDGNYIIETGDPDNVDIDTVLQLNESSSFNSGTLIEENDNYTAPGFPPFGGFTVLQARIEINLLSGTYYCRVRMADNSASTDNFSILFFEAF